MMDMGMSMIMVFMMFGGGFQINDLVSTVQLDAYWNAQGIEMTTENMVAQLPVETKPVGDISKLIEQLGDDNFQQREAATAAIRKLGKGALPQLTKAAKTDDIEVASRIKGLIGQISNTGGNQAVRRLLAIRTLGQRRMEASLATLRKLSESKQPFIGDYAIRAIAQIKGKPYTTPALSDAELDKDLWMMPKELAIVGQSQIRGGQSLDVKAMIAKLPAQLKANLPPAQLQQMVTQMNQAILQVADSIGNVRVDAVTFGISADAGPDSGFAIGMVRGQYDAAAVKAYLTQSMGLQFDKHHGMDVAVIEEEATLVLVSNHRLVIFGGPDTSKIPIDDILSGIKNGKGSLDQNIELSRRIEKVNLAKNTTWVTGVISPGMKQEEPFSQIDSFTIQIQQEKQIMSFQFQADGPSAEQMTETVSEINQGLAQVKQQMAGPQAAGMMPKELLDLLNSIKISQAGKSMSVSGKMKGSGISIMMMGAMPLMMLRGAAAPPPPGVQPAPVPVDDAAPVQRPKR